MAQLHLGCDQIRFRYFNGGKMVDAPGAWFKRVVLSLLINHGCVFGVTCNRPITVSSPIPFKSQVRLHLGGLLLWWRICQVVRRNASLQRKLICWWAKWKCTIHNEHTGLCCSWILLWSATDHQLKVLFINLLQMYLCLVFEKVYFF